MSIQFRLAWFFLALGLVICFAGCDDDDDSTGAGDDDNDHPADDDVTDDDAADDDAADDDVSDDDAADDDSDDDDDSVPAEPLVWVQFTDIHQSRGSGTHKGAYGPWLASLQYVHDVVQPSFVAATGDLTDGDANGSYQSPADWDDYQMAIAEAGFTAADYYDLPGNHDAHHDCPFEYYLAQGISGAVRHTWTRASGPATYAFVATQTAHCDSDLGAFLQDAYDWTDAQLAAANDDTHVFVLAHHPDHGFLGGPLALLYDVGLFGPSGLLSKYHATAWVGGHIHRDFEATETGVRIITTRNHYSGLPGNRDGRMRLFVLSGATWASAAYYVMGHGSQVIVVSPQDARLAVTRSPGAHQVHGLTPVTAMAFGTDAIELEMTVDGGSPMMMSTADDRVWEAAFDFGALAPGAHTIEVRDVNNSDEINGRNSIQVESY